MKIPAIIFWVSFALCLYAYVGYPLLTWLIAACRSSRKLDRAGLNEWPSVTLLFAAHNEGAVLRQKIENFLALDYPEDRREVVVASDHSTDGSEAVAGEYASSGVSVVRTEVRTGKTGAETLGIKSARGEVIVFSDANSLFSKDSLMHLISAFADPEVGCAVGQLRYSNPEASGNSFNEQLYWRYEGLLKRWQARAGALLFANGAIYALRKSLYQPIPREFDHDTMLPLLCRIAGQKVAFVPKAVAYEQALTEFRGEFRRKVRGIIRDAHTFVKLKFLLFPFRPWLAFHLISSKLLRWHVGPILLFLLGANSFLLDIPFYRFTMAIQAAFYGLAIIGLGFSSVARKVKPLSILAYFCLVNAAAIVALGRVLTGQKVVTWEPRGG